MADFENLERDMLKIARSIPEGVDDEKEFAHALDKHRLVVLDRTEFLRLQLDAEDAHEPDVLTIALTCGCLGAIFGYLCAILIT